MIQVPEFSVMRSYHYLRRDTRRHLFYVFLELLSLKVDEFSVFELVHCYYLVKDMKLLLILALTLNSIR